MLAAQDNSLRSITGVTHLHSLHELDMRRNLISTLADAAPAIRLPRLATLRLEGCPVSRERGYRLAVLRAAARPISLVLDGRRPSLLEALLLQRRLRARPQLMVAEPPPLWPQLAAAAEAAVDVRPHMAANPTPVHADG